MQLGCKELRAKRFISDGFCTSIKPIKEVVCAGQCMPIKEQNLPWWAEFTKYWAKPKHKEWRCVENITKLKKVQLMCQDGTSRHYKIKIVKSCRCKSYEREPNETGIKPTETIIRRRKQNLKDKPNRRRDRREKRRLRKQRERELRKQNKKRNKSSKSKGETQRTRERDSSYKNERHTHSPGLVSVKRRHPVGTNASPEL